MDGTPDAEHHLFGEDFGTQCARRGMGERQIVALTLASAGNSVSYKPEFRSHWTCLDMGREDVADYELNWATQSAIIDTNRLDFEVRRRWPWIMLGIASGEAHPSAAAMPEGARFFRKPYNIGRVVDHFLDATSVAA
jgi:hypothetical protein